MTTATITAIQHEDNRRHIWVRFPNTLEVPQYVRARQYDEELSSISIDLESNGVTGTTNERGIRRITAIIHRCDNLEFTTNVNRSMNFDSSDSFIDWLNS